MKVTWEAANAMKGHREHAGRRRHDDPPGVLQADRHRCHGVTGAFVLLLDPRLGDSQQSRPARSTPTTAAAGPTSTTLAGYHLELITTPYA
jgi:hypothetical protein